MKTENSKEELKAPTAVQCSALFGDFKPSLRNTWGTIWEASIELPGVGKVTTEGHGWEEAKLRLWIVSEAVSCAPAPCSALLAWAVERWNAEVKNRPLVNINRRPLDDTWRQVIRYAVGNDRELVGPTHDELLLTPNDKLRHPAVENPDASKGK